jgi:hypothetical protein
MKKVLQRKTLSVVLQLEAHRKDDPSPSAHIILNHCDLDDDGNICLSSSMSVRGMLEAIGSLQSELDGLANEIMLALTETAAPRRAHLSVIFNDDPDLGASTKSSQGHNS